MTAPLIHPVLLAGGSGTRLWPASRQSYPKQFAPLLAEESLFQATAHRLTATGFVAPTIITANAFRFIVAEQLQSAGISPRKIVIEPEPRDTAPAALAAAMDIAADAPQALVLIAPTDHAIPDVDAFRSAVHVATPAAIEGRIVTFGVTPDRPETGYGYLALADSEEATAQTPRDLEGFLEKPDTETARQLVSGGRHLWNAGIYLARADVLVETYAQLAPKIQAQVQTAHRQAVSDLDFLRLDPEAWSIIDPISIDYAIMEKAQNLSVMPYSGHWSDLGSWEAVWQETAPDADGNATSGQATAIECSNTLLRSEVDGLELIGLGLDDVVAVAMPDAVLVARKSDSHAVKRAVDTLKERNCQQATEFPRNHRPWGWFESLVTGDRFQVKRIIVKPGAALSLQSHLHRAEHWIVVQGTAKVTVDDATRLVPENESIFVPLGARHRLENPGKVPVVLIEVQTGRYLGEDDVIRHEDLYARS